MVLPRHPRESGGPELIIKMDSRFRGNDRGEVGMTEGKAGMTSPFPVIPAHPSPSSPLILPRHPRENGDPYSKLLDF